MDGYAGEPVSRMVHQCEFKRLEDGRRRAGATVIRLAEHSRIYLPALSKDSLSKEANPASPDQRARIIDSTTPDANDYPRVFQAWNKADNLGDENPLSSMARHDLCFMTPEGLGLQADNSYPGLAAGFTEQSVAEAKTMRAQLLKKNPRMIILAAIPYRDALPSYFPIDSAFWQRDEKGAPVAGWADTLSTKGCWKIDFTKTEVQDLVRAKCVAALNCGVVDGIMLDWWNDGAADAAHNRARLDLLRKIRAAVGPDALILVNANNIRGDGDSPSCVLLRQSAPLVNGIFMESVQTLHGGVTGTLATAPGQNLGTYTKEDWHNIEQALIWNETHMRPPHINCLEIWFQSSRHDESLMRAATTLSLTHSNGYCLFGDPNRLPTPDHLHSWYQFWNKSLGKPTEAPGRMRKDGSYVREFQNGTVIYNSSLNHGPVTITFSDQRIRASQADPQLQPAGTAFVIEPCDGDIFLKAK